MAGQSSREAEFKVKLFGKRGDEAACADAPKNGLLHTKEQVSNFLMIPKMHDTKTLAASRSLEYSTREHLVHTGKIGVMTEVRSFSSIVVEAIRYPIVFMMVAVKANHASFLLRNPVVI